jgi:tRNA(Ile)-lysidine synthase
MHATLLAQLNQLPTPKRYVIALSGGCDSVALLHAIKQIQTQLACQQIIAVHIDHGLQSFSANWSLQCKQLCTQHQIPLTVIELNLTIAKGESLEAVARHARYAAFGEFLQDQDMLLLAHHQNDQAETLLLQMLRGSGVNGLACMPAITQVNNNWLARPLLGQTRESIEHYAREQQLSWIDDPSNQETRFDRNFLRHDIMPVLQSRWPALTTTLARVAQHQAEAKGLLTDLAEMDWHTCQTQTPQQVSVHGLQQLSAPRARNLLRYWIHTICHAPLPDSVHLQRILDEVLPAAVDAAPLVSWANVQLRRYRDALYLEVAPNDDIHTWYTHWDLHAPLQLPTGESLATRRVSGAGLLLDAAAPPVTVKFRQGGERCRLPGRVHHHELKKCFQQWGVPPWQRDRIPLIYIGQELAQIVGYSVCEPFRAKSGQSGIEIYLHH